MSPTPSRYFTGRRPTLDTIKDALIPGPGESHSQRIFVLSGMVGSGKSEVALKFMEESHTHFGGCFWIDVSSSTSAERGFIEMANLCGFRKDCLGNTLKDLARVESSWLVVLDNYDTDYIQFFSPAHKGSILITTRDSDLTTKYNSASVDEMDDAEALVLLLKTIGTPETEQPHHEHLARIAIDLLGRHALAIAHVGASINDGLCTLEDFPRMFEQDSVRFLKHHPTTTRSRYPSIWETFESSMQILEKLEGSSGNTAQKLLRILPYMDFEQPDATLFSLAWETSQELSQSQMVNSIESLSTWHLGQAKESSFLEPPPFDALRRACTRLQQFGLITISARQPLSVSMHPLVASWARDRLVPQQQAVAWATASAILALSTRQSVKWEEASYLLEPHLESCYKHYASVKAQVEPSVKTEIAQTFYWFCWQLLAVRSQSSVPIARLLRDWYTPNLDAADTNAKAVQRLLARCLSDAGEDGEAVILLEELVNLERRRLQNNDPHFLDLQHELAVAYTGNNHSKKAISLLKDVVKIKKTLFGAEDPRLLSFSQKLASAYIFDGENKKAIQILKQVLGIRGRLLSPKHPDLLETQHELAVAWMGVDKYEQATPLLEQIVETESTFLRPEHPDRLASQIELADAYMGVKKFKEAVELLEYVVETQSSTLKPEHKNILTSQHVLGCAYQCAGSFEQAVEILEKVTKTEERIYGVGHEGTKESTKMLAVARKVAKDASKGRP